MIAIRPFLFAVIGCLSWMPPASAAPDGTLGMALLSAKVRADGTLVHGSGTISSSNLGTGTYAVVFDRDLSFCTFAGTVTQIGGGGAIDVDLLSASTVAVFVETRSLTTGVLTDKPFQLIVFCAK